MIYKDFQGESLSTLGMGTMRLPVIEGDDSKIDEARAAEMIGFAYENGVNYFDTAWGYHDGTSESVVGRALSNYPRESFKIATKFPGYDVSNFGKHEEIFEKQMEKLQVDYVDFYLIHNICELDIEQYLDDEKYGTVSYFIEQRKAGRIKHLGFSVHAGQRDFERFMDKYGDHMEFCQIQLNYMDWDFQNAKAKVRYLNERNIPIWVMEPLRGGNLCSVEDDDEAVLKSLRPDATVVEWAYRYLQSVPGVQVVLTGASTLEQLKQNIELFSDEAPLSEDEMAAIVVAGKHLAAEGALPCTSCHYCVSHCPRELDIPYLISLYNEHVSRENNRFLAPMAIGAMPEAKRPSACVGCKRCEAVCPQKLPIADTFKSFVEMLAK